MRTQLFDTCVLKMHRHAVCICLIKAPKRWRFWHAPFDTRMSDFKTRVFAHLRKAPLVCSEILEGHHPRGTTLREALRGNLPLMGLCGGLSEGSAGSLRAFCVASPRVLGSAGFSKGFSGVVTLCSTPNMTGRRFHLQ